MTWRSIFAVTASVLIGTILTLSVCVGACSVVSASNTESSCPKHPHHSDCCKQSSSDSESASWNPLVVAMCPVADIAHLAPVLMPSHKEVFTRIDIADSSGGLPALVVSRLRI